MTSEKLKQKESEDTGSNLPIGFAGWHLDRRVPITMIAFLVLQTCGLVIWGSKIDSSVKRLENIVVITKLAKIASDKEVVAADRRVTRIEVLQGEVIRRLDNFDSKLNANGQKIDKILAIVNERLIRGQNPSN